MRYLAGPMQNGKRLDRALVQLMEPLGLRASRRLIGNGCVLVNGRSGFNAQKIAIGDILEIRDPQATAPVPGAFLLDICGSYCFFHKPAGMHTVALKGGNEPSLEAQIPAMLGKTQTGQMIQPELLQRLDHGTSGIVCAALDNDAKVAFRKMEAAGNCRKYYLALLEGRCGAPLRATAALDCDNRKRTRVLATAAPADRHTMFFPLYVWPDFASLGEMAANCAKASWTGPVTLALCTLLRGQRHQIRAHAASIGHPLLGDALYGSGLENVFFLAHFFLQFGRYKILDMGKNSLYAHLPPAAQESVDQWLLKAEKGRSR